MLFNNAGRYSLRPWIVVFLFLGGVWPIYADPSPAGTESLPAVEGSAAAGFGSYYRIGRCTPVTIRLENTGADMEGSIQIRISRDRYIREVSLPSPSRKTLTMYIVPPEDLHELEISLYSAGKLLKKFTPKIKRLSDEQLLTIVSSTLKTYVSSIDEHPEQTSKEKRAFLDPGDFPEAWNDYEAVDSIILDVSDVTKFNDRQRTAVARWTLLGGKVNLLDRHRAAEGEWTQDRPIAVLPNPSRLRTSRGIGTFGTFGLSDQTLLSGESSFTGYRPSIPDLDREAFHSDRIRNPFSRAYILVYIGAFFLLYTIAAAFWLRVFDRTGWATHWRLLAVPVAAIGCSFSCLWIGRAVNAGDTTVRQRSVIHVFVNNSDIFAVNEYVMLFPRKTEYRFHPAYPSAHIVQDESENETPMITYEFTGAGAPSVSFEENLWGTRSLNLSYFSDQGPFLILQGPETITITNRSPDSLEECRLLRSGVSTSIGSIPAGGKFLLNPAPDEETAHPDPDPLGIRTGEGIFPRVVAEYRNEANTENIGDCVICSVNGSIPGLTSDDTGMSYAGSSTVVFHLGMDSKDGSDLERQ